MDAMKHGRVRTGENASVVLVEDDPANRRLMKGILELGGFRVHSMSSGEEGLDWIHANPDGFELLITDVRMPPTHTDEGLRAALVIRARHPELPILVLSQYVEERYAADLLGGRTRGVGYLLKDRVADVEDFLAALRRVAEGGTALDPEVVAQLLARTRQRVLQEEMQVAKTDTFM